MTATTLLRRAILSAAAIAALGAGAACAQTYYGGYNLGPDYGAMIGQVQRQQQLMNQEMQRREQAVVQNAMQDPNCQALYQRHRAGGGAMPYPQFAYQYAATGGFTPEGIRRYQQSEAANRGGELAALQGVRQAEQQRGQAQQGLADGYGRNQIEMGRVMQGQNSWVDPMTGQNRALPYMGQAYSRDPNTGQQFVRDAQGIQWAQMPNGQWMQMAPAR